MGVFIDTINRARQNTKIRRASAAGAVILTGAVIAIGVHSGSAPATANLWVNATGGGSCTRAAAAAAYDATKACSSFQNAYNASSGGDLVLVKSGAYTATKFSVNSGTRSPATTIRVESGGTATVRDTEITYRGVNGLVVDGTQGANGEGLDISTTGNSLGLNYNNAAVLQNFTFKGFKIHDNILSGNDGNQVWGGTNCSNVTLAYGEIANIQRADAIQMGPVGANPGCNGVTFDHLFIHDFTAQTGDHQDGLQVRGGSNITFQNSRIMNMTFSGSQGVFMNPQGDLGGDNMVIQNNVIEDSSSGGSEINLCSVHATVRYNTINGSLNSSASQCGNPTAWIVVGNLLSSCTGLSAYKSQASAGTYGFNATGSACGLGANDSTCSPFASNFTGPISGVSASQNYDLTSGACAIDKGTTSNYPTTDLLGRVRYGGSAPDAGAYEFGVS